jgi:hypothetical protein
LSIRSEGIKAMKTEMKLNILLHVEGYSSDIFKVLSTPELKEQYESYLGTNEPLFEDDPSYRLGSISIDSMESLLKTVRALDGVAKKLAVYISGDNKEAGINFSGFIGDHTHGYKTGCEVRVDEGKLNGVIRDAAKEANRILSNALMLRIDERE